MDTDQAAFDSDAQPTDTDGLFPFSGSLAVTPDAPEFDDDLHCVVSDPPVGWSWTMTWTRDGAPVPIGASSSTTFPNDTIPDKSQAGGEHWSCTGHATRTADGLQATLRSQEVVIGWPIPMATIPPGVFDFTPNLYLVGDYGAPVHRSLTHSFAFSQYEVSEAIYARFMGSSPSGAANGPDAPVVRVTWYDAVAFTNTLSEADGIEPCGVCTTVDGKRTCTLNQPEDPYACRGYRPPTLAEWQYVATEAGRHDDYLPAGGRYDLTCVDYGTGYCDWYRDPEATGPYAPPDTTVASQCWLRRQSDGYGPADVGTLLPDRFGIFDLCGNASEFVLDAFGDIVPGENPYRAQYTYSLAEAAGSDYGSSYVEGGSVRTVQWLRKDNSSWGLSIRVVRVTD